MDPTANASNGLDFEFQKSKCTHLLKGQSSDSQEKLPEKIVLHSDFFVFNKYSQKLIDAIPDGFSVIDFNGGHLYVNSALCDMTGFKREELIGVFPPHPYWPEEEQVFKFLAIPVMYENSVVAVVAVANKQSDYDASDVRQLTLMMNAVWKIIRQQEDLLELEKMREHSAHS